MTAPLRIVLAIGIYEPDHGGAAEWVRNYATWLVRRGHSVCLVCERAEAPVPDGCALRTLPTAQHTKNAWRHARALQKMAQELPADVVHDTGGLLSADVFHPLMGSLVHNWRRQLNSWPRALAFRRFWHVRLWRDVRLHLHQSRSCKVLVACSKRAAFDFKQLRRSSVVIRNGIRETTAATEAEIHALRESLDVGDRVLMLASATNFYLKGIMTLLCALSLLDVQTRRKLLVVITGEHQDNTFQNVIDQNNLGDCCRLAGWVENIQPYYDAAEVFLHPTYHDAGSLSTLKAIGAGCAVVTTRFDGSAELLSNGETGIILKNPADPQQLAHAMQHLLDPELRQRLRTAVVGLTPLTREEPYFLQLEGLYYNIQAEKRA